MARYQDPYGSPSAPSGGVDLTPAAQAYRAPTPSPSYGPPRPPQYPTLPQAQYGQPGYQTPRFPGFRPTQEFANDPTTANLERMANFQIPYYMQPVQQRNYLAGTSGEYGRLNDTINNLLGQFGSASPGENALMSIFGSLAGGGNADAYANEYRSQLKVDPYSGAEGEAYQTEFADPIAAQRDQAVARTMREISAQNIDPSSGIAQAKLALTRGEYDKALAGAQNKMAIDRNQQRMLRQGQAFQAGLSAEQLKNQAKSAAASAAGGAANAWANRLGQMLDTAGFGNTAALQRAQMGYQTDAALRAEQNANFGTAAQYAQYMADLPARRQQEALQLMSGNDPSNVVSGYGQMSNQRVNEAQVGSQASQQIWNGIGSMWPYLQAGMRGTPTPAAGGYGGGGGYGGPTIAPPGQMMPGTGYMPGNVQWPGF